MNLRRAMLIAACLTPGATASAVAQMQPPQQEPPCMQDFVQVARRRREKGRGHPSASERKRRVDVREACKLFNAFSAAEAKMVKYTTDNAVWCGIPPNVIDNIKQSHVKTVEMRTKVCQAAAAPQRPAGPTLSDALTAPVTDSNKIRTGRGTFDTLTGTPLGGK